jgi:hypothetical protein
VPAAFAAAQRAGRRQQDPDDRRGPDRATCRRGADAHHHDPLVLAVLPEYNDWRLTGRRVHLSLLDPIGHGDTAVSLALNMQIARALEISITSVAAVLNGASCLRAVPMFRQLSGALALADFSFGS